MKKIILFALFLICTSAAQEGLVKTYYNGGQLQSEVNYKNNIRDGEAKFYYESGNLKEERIYINGRVEGLIRLYYQNGNLMELANLENGKREGPTSLYDSSGAYLSDVEFAEGVRIMPVPEQVLPVIASDTEGKEKEPAAPKKQNNIKKTQDYSVPPPVEDTMEDDPAFFSTAEVMPQPVGGMSAVYKRLVYPREAKNKGIEGTVKILVYIDQWGDVTQTEVVEGIGHGCDESARTTIYYTKFSPGLIRGKPVKMRIVVSLEFKLPFNQEG